MTSSSGLGCTSTSGGWGCALTAGLGNGALAVVFALDDRLIVEVAEVVALLGEIGGRLDVESTTNVTESGQLNTGGELDECKQMIGWFVLTQRSFR